ncbi:unnamed protein product [Closterium sp. Naga37s-1]|nr:unnamed protein product [Closterium sp. Naga37s-1]
MQQMHRRLSLVGTVAYCLRIITRRWLLRSPPSPPRFPSPHSPPSATSPSTAAALPASLPAALPLLETPELRECALLSAVPAYIPARFRRLRALTLAYLPSLRTPLSALLSASRPSAPGAAENGNSGAFSEGANAEAYTAPACKEDGAESTSPPASLTALSALCSLHLVACGALTRLPSPPVALQTIAYAETGWGNGGSGIRGSSSTTTTPTNTTTQAPLPLLPSLTCLRASHCARLTALTRAWMHLPSLQELILNDNGQMESLFDGDNCDRSPASHHDTVHCDTLQSDTAPPFPPPLPSLLSLTVSNCPRISRLPAFLSCSPTLLQLKLHGLSDLTLLPFHNPSNADVTGVALTGTDEVTGVVVTTTAAVTSPGFVPGVDVAQGSAGAAAAAAAAAGLRVFGESERSRTSCAAEGEGGGGAVAAVETAQTARKGGGVSRRATETITASKVSAEGDTARAFDVKILREDDEMLSPASSSAPSSPSPPTSASSASSAPLPPPPPHLVLSHLRSAALAPCVLLPAAPAPPGPGEAGEGGSGGEEGGRRRAEREAQGSGAAQFVSPFLFLIISTPLSHCPPIPRHITPSLTYHSSLFSFPHSRPVICTLTHRTLGQCNPAHTFTPLFTFILTSPALADPSASLHPLNSQKFSFHILPPFLYPFLPPPLTPFLSTQSFFPSYPLPSSSLARLWTAVNIPLASTQSALIYVLEVCRPGSSSRQVPYAISPIKHCHNNWSSFHLVPILLTSPFVLLRCCLSLLPLSSYCPPPPSSPLHPFARLLSVPPPPHSHSQGVAMFGPRGEAVFQNEGHSLLFPAAPSATSAATSDAASDMVKGTDSTEGGVAGVAAGEDEEDWIRVESHSWGGVEFVLVAGQRE